MTTYLQLLEKLNGYKEENFAAFQRRLIPTFQSILGVRTPILRRLAKDYKGSIEEVLNFPDEFYEVTFIKLTIVASLPYGQFVGYLPRCVSLIDNWATCDSFKAKCLKKHKKEFLPLLEKLFLDGGEFFQRYALVVLLSEYVQEEYLPIVKEYLHRADTRPYYVYMAAAWLTAEVLIKYYDFGVEILKEGRLDAKTHNKAIQKARESYRLTQVQKEYLNSLKIKNKE